MTPDNTTPIPSKEENPNGLHGKYKIQKFVRMESTGFGFTEKPVFKDVDPGSEYFVLRLDDKQKDKVHHAACIMAVLAYAEAIKDHLPQLSEDLIKRYRP